jgi:hypothetical protein
VRQIYALIQACCTDIRVNLPQSGPDNKRCDTAMHSVLTWLSRKWAVNVGWGARRLLHGHVASLRYVRSIRYGIVLRCCDAVSNILTIALV